MKRISASKLEIAYHCQAPWTSDMPWEAGTSPAARYGTEIHEMIETHLSGRTPTPPTSKHAKDHRAWVSWWDNSIRVEGCEVPYVFMSDGTTARLAGRGRDAYEHVPLNAIVGTADCVTQYSVIDWKTGKHITEAKDSVQLRFLGAVAGKPEINLVQIRNGEVDARGHTLTVNERDEIKNDCSKLLKILNDSPQHVGGEWCRWCPCRAACPKNSFAKSAKTPEKQTFDF